MLDWKALSRRSILTVFGLCLVGLCVVPFLLGGASCDEFNAALLDQSALLDEDNVDPSKATVDSFCPITSSRLTFCCQGPVTIGKRYPLPIH